MSTKMQVAKLAMLAATMVAAAVAASGAAATTIWTDWTSATFGAPGSATGTLGGIGVAYVGEVTTDATNTAGTSAIWSPDTSFIGGTVTTSPSAMGDAISLQGGYAGTNNITFASPILNPVFAFWSLGRESILDIASFEFIGATPTLEAGGPNAGYGGKSIAVSGNVVSGMEGNGTVQFTGTFSSLSWTDTVENYYAFTVGQAGTARPAGDPQSVPEPATLALLGLGLAGLAATRRRKGC